MTRRAALGLWAGLILVMLAGGVLLACTFGILAAAAALLGAERVGVFLFACALVPMLLVGYLGRVVHERMRKDQQRPRWELTP